MWGVERNEKYRCSKRGKEFTFAENNVVCKVSEGSGTVPIKGKKKRFGHQKTYVPEPEDAPGLDELDMIFLGLRWP